MSRESGTNTLASQPKVVQVNGVEICVQSFGTPRDPAVLLIHGAAASMMGWPDSFCQDLAAHGRFVLRYDHRDTGESVSYPPGEAAYTLRDLGNDALGVLDWFELERAHVVGISMGGAIALNLALDHPDRVSTLTLMATTSGEPGLPPPSQEFLAFASSTTPPEWENSEAVVRYMLKFFAASAGTHCSFDEAAARDLLEADVLRSTANPASAHANHFSIEAGEPSGRGMEELNIPALVIHGERDPVFPLEHAESLARRIPNARLITLADSGHLILWQKPGEIVAALVEHTFTESG